jgi:hypothetical protein
MVTTPAQLASAHREGAAAQDQYAEALERLEPPSEGAEYHRMLLDLVSRYAESSRETARAIEAGDSVTPDDEEALRLAQQALELEEEHQKLILLVLAEHNERPLNSYLLQAEAVRVPFLREYQDLLDAMQLVLAFGGIDELAVILTEQVGLFRAFSDEWDELDPPKGTRTFHHLQAEMNGAATQAIEATLAALEDEDQSALEDSLLQFLYVGSLSTELVSLRTNLLISALAGSPAVESGLSFLIADALVEIAVQSDGSLLVSEHLTYSFSGIFEGAYRDIPTRPDEEVLDVSVSESGTPYSPGAPTALGSSGAVGSYGTEDLGTGTRIVWHFRATDEDRTFTVSYRMTGVAVAYDDVVDVNVKVWGDEWAVPLDQLNAIMTTPGSPEPGDVFVWGHPESVQGFTEFAADGVTPLLYAESVGPGQFVEMRVVFPRSHLVSLNGVTARAGPGLEVILAEELNELP